MTDETREAWELFDDDDAEELPKSASMLAW
jgi:hypothetical protein